MQIVGPEGLRSWLRAVLGNSYASLGGLQLQIHELTGLRAFSKRGLQPPVRVSRPLPCEVEGSTITPSADGAWDIPAATGHVPVQVRAVELVHSVPTVGWIVEEHERPGALPQTSL